MSEESMESKARKLAAARKKLKEYQQRGTASGINTVSSYTYADSTNSGQISSNISERSESELQLNCNVNDIKHTEGLDESVLEVSVKGDPAKLEDANYFILDPKFEQTESNRTDVNVNPTIFSEDTFSEDVQNINATQVLITEKSQLTTEVNKYRTLCREKDLEIEELRVQHTNASKRVEELTQRLVELQKQQEQQRLHNAELQHKLAQAREQKEDHSNHISELQQQLARRDEQLNMLETDFKDKCNELDLSHLRIRQLSDENSITKDNRVENLTQAQFMYEQQIRDLQAMVQQLNQDKEQANTQYQTYVQQLNAQVQQLNERNNELTDETTKLEDREKHWVDHVQQLEKEIQMNISRQAEVKEQQQKESSSETSNELLQTLQERINDFDSERYEFQLKVKSQDDQLNSLQYDLKKKDGELQQLKEHLEKIAYEQPDKTKLLAAMESDKVAASRAIAQNLELKKQLDELELRFVQLTNDKAELMNRLDSEQFTNREMHINYEAMEERLKSIDERFKFKDDEMIRLSNENEELKKVLEKKKFYLNKENDEVEIGHRNRRCNHLDDHEYEHYHDHPHVENEKPTNDIHHDDYNNKQLHHDVQHVADSEQNLLSEEENCLEATEENYSNSTKPPPYVNHIIQVKSETNATHIATEDAVAKLENRFTQLMTQCADLTEEKQRLEHLVMQLQSETETIGEYITLYQTQRRILKQREYEKTAQTAMLQAEREQMHERLTMLDNLVNTLSMELPQNQQINGALAQNTAHDVSSQCHEDNGHAPMQICSRDSQTVQMPAKDLKSPESQQILHRIQDIITEIKENTKELNSMTNSVDQLNCCSGKFEVV